MDYDWLRILRDLNEIMELADIGFRHKRAVDLLLDGKDIDIPAANFSDRYRPGFRLTPLQHQFGALATAAVVPPVQPRPSTNHERETDRTGVADPDVAAVRSIQ